MRAESVSGYDAVAAHFPGGLTDPTRVIGSTERAAALQQAIAGTPGVVSVTEAGRTDAGLVQRVEASARQRGYRTRRMTSMASEVESRFGVSGNLAKQ